MVASKEIPITFGVELEFLFAFHEDLLRNLVDIKRTEQPEQYPSTLEINGPEEYQHRIQVKHLDEERVPVFPNLPNRAYNSWCFRDTATKRTFRYRNQPAQILLKELEKETLFDLDVLDATTSSESQWASSKKKSNTNNRSLLAGGCWSLRNAPSVVGVGSENIPRYATFIPDVDTPN